VVTRPVCFVFGTMSRMIDLSSRPGLKLFSRFAFTSGFTSNHRQATKPCLLPTESGSSLLTNMRRQTVTEYGRAKLSDRYIYLVIHNGRNRSVTLVNSLIHSHQLLVGNIGRMIAPMGTRKLVRDFHG
jgi:hypothetical protein